MTLLDAPVYDRTRSKKRRTLLVCGLLLCVGVGFGIFLAWNLAAEHRVNQFFAAVEAQDFSRAFGIWNNDPDWQHHAQQYAAAGYSYGRFVNDWGTGSDYGVISSHKILYSTSRYGNNTLLAVEINGRKTALLTLSLANGRRSFSFPPFALAPVQNGFGWTVWQVSYR